MTKNKLYCIYTRKIAIKLRERGFPIIKTDINHRYPQYDCYFFLDTEEFQKALSEISKEKRKED